MIATGLLKQIGNKRALAITLSKSVTCYENVSSMTLSCSAESAEIKSGGRKSAAVVAKGDKGKDGGSQMNLLPVKGTRDFYPDEMRLKNWLFNKWRNVAKRFGFEEYDAPILESEELYIRKAGEEVTQQLFNFEDKGGRRLSLRPEMTPSLARMVLAKRNGLSFPLKWFAIPQCWRYERMTRGRRREHYQWNMDIWGVAGVEAEAELLSAIVTSFQDMGITSKDVGIKINSRRILNGLMTAVGIPEDKWVETCILVDKLEKVPVEALLEDLDKLGLQRDTVEKLLSYLKMKDIEEFATTLGPQAAGVQDILSLLQLAEGYGIADWVQFDASVVRGLAYYTGVVFEGFDRKGELRAICGGGRYDRLLHTMMGGGTAEGVPAVGFGFGDAVIVELLKDRGLLPELLRGRGGGDDVDVVVYAMEAALRGQAAQLATSLRQNQVAVDLVLDDRKPKWVFQRADKLGVKVVLLLAAAEAAQGQLVVKDLLSGQQQTVEATEAVDRVLGLLTNTGEGAVATLS